MSSTKSLDELLSWYTGDSDNREWMRQANTVGDYTYATDARVLIIVPNSRLKGIYGCHAKVADYKDFLTKLTPIDPVAYSFSDLNMVLEKVEKVFDSSNCYDCDGEGKCSHCGAECDTCRGNGEVIDKSLPKVFPKRDSAVRISDAIISPYHLDLLRNTLKTLRADTFNLGWKNSGQIMVSVEDIRILFAGLYTANPDYCDYPLFDLHPIIN